MLNYAEVARSLGVSQPTARDYFDIAHGTFVWRTIPAFTQNALKRLVKHPKGYLRDSGLLHALLRIPDTDALLSHPQMGNSWERQTDRLAVYLSLSDRRARNRGLAAGAARAGCPPGPAQPARAGGCR